MEASSIGGDDDDDDDDDDYVNMDVQQCMKQILSNDAARASDYDMLPDTQSSLQDVIKLGAGTRKMWSEMPQVIIYNVYNDNK